MAKEKKTYYAAFPLGENSEPLHTGRNTTSEQECIEDVFDFITQEMDDIDEDKPFEQFTYAEKERVVKSTHYIESQDEPYDEEGGDDEDDDTESFLREYGSNITVNESGTRYGRGGHNFYDDI